MITVDSPTGGTLAAVASLQNLFWTRCLRVRTLQAPWIAFEKKKKGGGGGGFSSPSAMVSCSGRWEDFKRLPSKKSVYPMCLPSSAEQRRKLSTRRNKVACCERKPLMGKSSRNFKKHFNGHCCGMEAANHLDYGPILFTAITRKWKELCWKWHICVSEWQWFGRICWENAEKKCHISASSPKNTHRQILLCLRIFSRWQGCWESVTVGVLRG